MEGNFGSGKIWQIIIQTASGKSLSGAHPKLYNCFTNDISNAHAAPHVKLIEAVMPCSEARSSSLATVAIF